MSNGNDVTLTLRVGSFVKIGEVRKFNDDEARNASGEWTSGGGNDNAADDETVYEMYRRGSEVAPGDTVVYGRFGAVRVSAIDTHPKNPSYMRAQGTVVSTGKDVKFDLSNNKRYPTYVTRSNMLNKPISTDRSRYLSQLYVGVFRHDPGNADQLGSVSHTERIMFEYELNARINGGHLQAGTTVTNYGRNYRVTEEQAKIAQENADDFMRAITERAEPSTSRLYRGLAFSNEQIAGLTLGKQVDMPISSWTGDMGVAKNWSQRNGASAKFPVILVAEPGTTGTSLYAMGNKDTSFPQTLSGGRFEITGVEKQVDSYMGEVTYVNVKQLAFHAKALRPNWRQTDPNFWPAWFPNDFDPDAAFAQQHVLLGKFLKIGDVKKYSADQPRDSDGRFASGGGDASPVKTDSEEHPGRWAKEVIRDLGAGKKPYVNSREVGRLFKQIMKSSSLQKAASTADITELRVNGTRLMGQDGLGYPRSEMPQIPSNMRSEFFNDLRSQGITVTPGTADPLSLQPSQSEIGATRAAEVYMQNGGRISGKQILISQDNYVIDGHHHWAAAVASALRSPGDDEMPVIRLGANGEELVGIAKQWATEHNIPTRALGKLFKYNPDQPRDAQGRFTSGGGSGDGKSSDDDYLGNRLGRCYELSGRYILNNADVGRHYGDKLVHGSIQGGNNPRIGHAWVVTNNGKTVYEPATNKEWDADIFNHYFNAVPAKEYNFIDAMREMASNGHWGPWGTPGKDYYDDSELRKSIKIILGLEIVKYSEDEARGPDGRWLATGISDTDIAREPSAGRFSPDSWQTAFDEDWIESVINDDHDGSTQTERSADRALRYIYGEDRNKNASSDAKTYSPGERQAIRNYMSIGGYEDLNAYLRGQNTSILTQNTLPEHVPELDDQIDLLDRAISDPANTTQQDAVVYRGILGHDLAANSQVGDVYQDDGYSSTSLYSGVASQFTSQGEPGLDAPDTLMEISVPAGSQMMPLFEDGAMEMLLGRGAYFRVDSLNGGVDGAMQVTYLGAELDPK